MSQDRKVPGLGDKVECTAVLIKESENFTRMSLIYWDVLPLAKPAEGFIIGKRNIRDTKIRIDEFGQNYKHINIRVAYLVVWDMNRKPYYVLAEHIKHV